uniref:Oxidoreductase-like protein n=1 Tax=Siphoviridae sp. ctBLh2 TaxID=2827803 RepID=A0A8S5S3K0_9CAUD|nr:MAG TPA: Oxidoreductase-like protein [Siphoviridae sp. ctBLh2]
MNNWSFWRSGAGFMARSPRNENDFCCGGGCIRM